MVRLKADLHVHSADDPCDDIDYSSEMLIDILATRGFTAAAITGHCRLVFYPHIQEYARQRGILLVPGVELMVEGKHVLVLNPDPEQAAAVTFAQLRSLGRRGAAIIAPHPYFLTPQCLGRRLLENIDLFDAVEYSCLYYRGLNLNKKAVRVAKNHGLPLLGTSDTHTLPYRDTTFSWLQAEEATVPGVIDAIRRGRIEVESRPTALSLGFKMGYYVTRKYVNMATGL